MDFMHGTHDDHEGGSQSAYLRRSTLEAVRAFKQGEVPIRKSEPARPVPARSDIRFDRRLLLPASADDHPAVAIARAFLQSQIAKAD